MGLYSVHTKRPLCPRGSCGFTEGLTSGLGAEAADGAGSSRCTVREQPEHAGLGGKASHAPHCA